MSEELATRNRPPATPDLLRRVLLPSIPLPPHLGMTLGQSHLGPFDQEGASLQKVRIV